MEFLPSLGKIWAKQLHLSVFRLKRLISLCTMLKANKSNATKSSNKGNDWECVGGLAQLPFALEAHYLGYRIEK